MKILITIIRWIVGLLFIFSGLVKANDPMGLSYKMQEFFEAWGILWMHDYTLAFSILMNAFEIVAGVAVIVGWRMRLFSWLLLLLIVFFTFLTGYASLATNPDGSLIFRSCGCFGDCLPLTPNQSFLKDLLLLACILLIFFWRNNIQPLFGGKGSGANPVFIVIAVVASLAVQGYTLRHLPFVDCLPFQVGKNLVEQRKMPADAVPDRYELRFIYEKNGQQQEFPVTALPDSSWTFKERKQVLLQKGRNNEPPIKDFELRTLSGTDSTEAILSQPGTYYLLFVQHFEGADADALWTKYAIELWKRRQNLWVVTGQGTEAVRFFGGKPGIPASRILNCDVTAIKTAARAIPTLFQMNGPVVVRKWSGADFDQIP